MPQSQARFVIHAVFSTKNRVPFLKVPEMRVRLHSYIGAILRDIKCEPITINSVEDHIHILSNFSRVITIADYVETVKSGPSKWMKEQGPAYAEFYWQRGYGAFSVSQSDVERLREYIAGQEEHHRRYSFQDEFRELCRKHGIEIDERYAWD